MSLAARPPLAAGASWTDWGQRLSDWLVLNLHRPLYAALVRSTDATAAAADTAYAITFDAPDPAEGIDRGSPTSRVQVLEGGLYLLDFTAHTAGAATFTFWVRVNGANYGPGSHSPALQRLVRLDRGDYVELMWSASSTAGSLDATAATAWAPATAAAGLTITRIRR